MRRSNEGIWILHHFGIQHFYHITNNYIDFNYNCSIAGLSHITHNIIDPRFNAMVTGALRCCLFRYLLPQQLLDRILYTLYSHLSIVYYSLKQINFYLESFSNFILQSLFYSLWLNLKPLYYDTDSDTSFITVVVKE